MEVKWLLSAIIGVKWGDEGKGKIIDHLAKNADRAARYSGGNNGKTQSRMIMGNLRCILYHVSRM